jgi:hypothetical protein
MSIRKLVHITCICDGPCGTTVEVDAAKVPEGWTLLDIRVPNGEQGKSPIKATGAYCPKCWLRLEAIFRHEGYSFVVKKDEVAADAR